MYRVFKLRQALLNGVALLVVAAGMIAGSIFESVREYHCSELPGRMSFLLHEP